MTGEPEQAEAIAPGLTGQHWLEGDHTVLIYGGRPSAEPDVALLTALKNCATAVRWTASSAADEEQSRRTAQLDKASSASWLTEVSDSVFRLHSICGGSVMTVMIRPDAPAKRRLPAAGTLYAPEQLAVMLEAQTLPLTEQGMSQLLADNRHDFLLRLAHTLC